MKDFKTQKGIIFREYNSGVNDKVVLMLDQKGRKLPFLVKGARKPNSKKNHSLEMGNLIKLKYIGGYSLAIATEIQIIEQNKHWKKDLKSMVLLQMVCETLTHFAIEDSEDSLLFDLASEILGIDPPGDNFALLSAIYLLKLLQISGSLPDLSSSVNDGQALDSKKLYIQENTIGYTSSISNKKIDERIYKTQRYAEGHSAVEAINISLSEIESKKFLYQMFDWTEIVIERELKSKKVVSNILK